MTITVEKESLDLSTLLGWTTLVYFSYNDDKLPREHGNCCGVANIYAENLKDLIKRWPEVAAACEVAVVTAPDARLSGPYYIITDSRVPKSWLNNKCDCSPVWGLLQQLGAKS